MRGMLGSSFTILYVGFRNTAPDFKALTIGPSLERGADVKALDLCSLHFLATPIESLSNNEDSQY